MQAKKKKFLNDIDTEVFPALYARLDSAFPEFGWIQKGRLWQASSESHTRTLPCSPRPARVQCYENTPFGLGVHRQFQVT